MMPPLLPGWIRYDGGACPVPADSRPALLFRSGSQFRGGEQPASAWSAFWRHTGSSMDVMPIAWNEAQDAPDGCRSGEKSLQISAQASVARIEQALLKAVVSRVMV